jgi:diacylglycerol kinase family enzyme
MRVSLLHNVEAGDGLSIGQLRREIEGAGHEIVREIEKGSELEGALEGRVDLIVVAGGDGTVGSAVQAFAGGGVPLAILPFGTANNIALALGIEGSLPELTRRWERGRRVPFDLGKARGEWGEGRFLEAAGTGLASETMADSRSRNREKGEESADEALEGARRLYREILAGLSPRRCSFEADGSRVEGEFLLIEVLNVPSLGPNLVLSPRADPSDGFFDLVTAGEEQRGELLAMLERAPGKRPPTLPTRRVRRVDVRDWGVMHLDGNVCPGSSAGDVLIEIEPGAIEFLV